MPVGTAKNVKVGPGKLYVAPIGTVEPADLVTAWNASWILLGYTDEGHTFTSSPGWDPIEVAESKVPIKYYQGNVEYSVEFAAAELTALNLQRALNGGTIVASGTGGTAIATYEPSDPSIEAVRLMLGWESDAADERWVYRRCVQSGDSAIARRKGPDKSTIPMSFNLEQPQDGSKPFKAIFSTAP